MERNWALLHHWGQPSHGPEPSGEERAVLDIVVWVVLALIVAFVVFRTRGP